MQSMVGVCNDPRLCMCRGQYFDVGLILDITSALYSEFKPLATLRVGGTGAQSQPLGGGSPLLHTLPGVRASVTEAEPEGPPATAHAARQRHLCCQLAERAFSVILLCLQQREAALLESPPASVQESERDALRRFMQRASAAVVRTPFPSSLLPKRY